MKALRAFAVDRHAAAARDGAECHLPPKAFDISWAPHRTEPSVVARPNCRGLYARTSRRGILNVLIGHIRRLCGHPRGRNRPHGAWFGYALCARLAARNRGRAEGQTALADRCEKTYIWRGATAPAGSLFNGVAEPPSVSRRHARSSSIQAPASHAGGSPSRNGRIWPQIRSGSVNLTQGGPPFDPSRELHLCNSEKRRRPKAPAKRR